MYEQFTIYHKDVPHGAAYSFAFSTPLFLLAPGRFPSFSLFRAPLHPRFGALSSFSLGIHPTHYSAKEISTSRAHTIASSSTLT